MPLIVSCCGEAGSLNDLISHSQPPFFQIRVLFHRYPRTEPPAPFPYIYIHQLKRVLIPPLDSHQSINQSRTSFNTCPHPKSKIPTSCLASTHLPPPCACRLRPTLSQWSQIVPVGLTQPHRIRFDSPFQNSKFYHRYIGTYSSEGRNHNGGLSYLN